MGALSSGISFSKKLVSNLELTASYPVPSGSDITGLGGAALTSGDFSIRDASIHWYVIPMTDARYTEIAIYLYHPTAFGVDVTLLVYAGYHSALTAGLLAQVSYTPVNSRTIAIHPYAVGVGGETLNTSGTSINRHNLVVPALAVPTSHVMVALQCSSAPSTGEVSMRVIRR